MLTPSKINLFTLIKLPAAYITGVKVKSIDNQQCTVSVKHRWINQNPFGSMFWAVQGMAAELSTGALMLSKIKESGKEISMLVVENHGKFFKKAKGRITFSCNQGLEIERTISKAISTGEGQTIELESVGINEENTIVSLFRFVWSIKVK
ncbi:MAG: DUF4442 domain-containing protein [Flavobacteriaceae bacterium]|nr:DUF4442 domain-containing protein [Flavobacteriaceae bacterium]